MALPNHPDVCYEFVRTLKECGYRWVLVQEHSVEQRGWFRYPPASSPAPAGGTNSHGQTLSITAIIKTQGSDTKLIGQMQPYYEAKGLSRVDLAGKPIPQLVTQIADGENGGAMMNEFPAKYFDVMREASGIGHAAVNVDRISGVSCGDRDPRGGFPAYPAVLQKRIWDRFPDMARTGSAGQGASRNCAKEDGRFHMEGGSWTNNLSWVRGYENVLQPIEKVSALFSERTRNVAAFDPRYRNALFNLLTAETSCYRYWGAACGRTTHAKYVAVPTTSSSTISSGSSAPKA